MNLELVSNSLKRYTAPVRGEIPFRRTKPSKNYFLTHKCGTEMFNFLSEKRKNGSESGGNAEIFPSESDFEPGDLCLRLSIIEQGLIELNASIKNRGIKDLKTRGVALLQIDYLKEQIAKHSSMSHSEKVIMIKEVDNFTKQKIMPLLKPKA